MAPPSGNQLQDKFVSFQNPENHNIDHISLTSDGPQKELPIIDYFDSQSSDKTSEDSAQRRAYHDEGGWRIIRQEKEENKKKYDFL